VLKFHWLFSIVFTCISIFIKGIMFVVTTTDLSSGVFSSSSMYNQKSKAKKPRSSQLDINLYLLIPEVAGSLYSFTRRCTEFVHSIGTYVQ
jgi:hypothetical protein